MNYLLSIYFLLISSTTFARTKQLDFDRIKHSQINLFNEVVGLHRAKNTFYSTSYFQNQFVVSSYKPDPKENELPFGTIYSDTEGSNRVSFENKQPSYWHGISSFTEKLIFLDVRKLKVIMLQDTSYKQLDKTDIILDLFRPAADSRGEPSSYEIKAARALFRRMYNGRDVNQNPLVSLTKINPINKIEQYLVLTRIKNFPLFSMHCDLKDGFHCKLARQCYLEGYSTKTKDRYGVSWLASKKWLFLGDSRKNVVEIFVYENCHHAFKVHELKLPKRLARIRGILVDKDENLWISTHSPDQYKNASVYMWHHKYWQKGLN